MDVVQAVHGGVPFYHCPAWTGVAHGFSTRLGGVSPAPWDSLNLGANRGDQPANVEENFRRFCAAIGTDPEAVVKNKQVHSTHIRAVTAKDVIGSLSDPGTFEADGMVTDQEGLCLTVFSGDCIPILLYDPVARCIGAVHAGWRGAAGGIAAQAAMAMQINFHSKPEDIRAAIGPGIGPCCFETHCDVTDALRTQMGQAAESCIRPLYGTDRFQVDLKGVNTCWLLTAGLTPGNISLCPACTGCDREHFWSHRMQGNARGTMAAMIQLVQ